MPVSPRPAGGRLPGIRETQVGLRDPSLVDRLKADMLAGRFRFGAREGRIGGVRDRKGTFHVIEGHHRVVVTLELYWETGDAGFVMELLRQGRWSDVSAAPAFSRPLPSRRWWGALRNWLGF